MQEKHETEQRYLVRRNRLEDMVQHADNKHRIIQGYLPPEIPGVTRHIRLYGTDEAFLIINKEGMNARGGDKSETLLAISIPRGEAEALLANESLLKRIRLRYQFNDDTGDRVCYVTMKGPRVGGKAPEYDYELKHNEPVLRMLVKYCGEKLLAKHRYDVGKFELDVFDQYPKTPIAEYEIKGNRKWLTELPPWAEREITGDETLSNYNLAGRDARAMAELKRELQRVDKHNVRR